MTVGMIQIHVPTLQSPPRLQPWRAGESGGAGGSEGGGITGGNSSVDGESANTVDATEARTSALMYHIIVVVWAGWRDPAHTAWPTTAAPGSARGLAETVVARAGEGVTTRTDGPHRFS